MRIELLGGPRDGDEFHIDEDGPWPPMLEVPVCLAADFIGSDVAREIPFDLIGETTVYVHAGCGRHYVHAGMDGHGAE